MPGQERHLRGPQAEAGDVIEAEVLQLIGPDLGLGRLDRAARVRRHQLRRDLGAENRQQGLRGRRLQLAGLHHPADQVLDQGLRQRAVDVVVAHLVADAVGVPAERDLRQVAGAEHEARMLVGQAEQVVGAKARLHVLEGHVIDLLALGEGVADVLQHAQRGRLDVDLLAGDPQRLHQRPGVGPGPLAGREPRHGEAQDVGSRLAERIESLGRHQQRMGGIQAAGDADDDVLRLGRPQALGQPLHLDVEGLVAVLIEPRRVARHEREAVEGPQQAQVLERRLVLEPHAPERRLRPARSDRGVVEGGRARPLQPQALDVDVGHRHLRLGGEPVGLGKHPAELVDRRLAVPGEVGRALARPSRRIKVGRLAAHRLRGAEQLAVVSLADHDVRGREVAEDQRAGERGARRGRGRRPDILADLRGEAEVGEIGGLEDQVRAERDALAGQLHCQPGHAGPGREPAILVEFPIVGQETFGRDSKDSAPRDHHRTVVERAVVLDRRAHHQHRRERLARGRETFDLRLDAPQQGVLQEQVVDGVGREPKLREQHQVDAARLAFLGQRQGLGGVEAGIAHGDGRRAGRHAHEAVAVDRVERFRHRRLRLVGPRPLAADLPPGRNAHFEHI